MITTIARSDNPPPQMRFRRAKGGFTLVEILVAASLSTMVGVAIMSSFLFLARSSVGLGNYSEMNSQSRSGLEIFGRDVRAARTIVPGFGNSSFTVALLDPNGGTFNIRYEFRPNAAGQPLVRIDASGNETVIMTGIKNLDFKYFDLQGNELVTAQERVPVRVKQVQLKLTLVRKTLSLDNTEKVVSARYVLRNKEVSI